MAMYLGDYAEDATLYFKWSTFDTAGASVTRATDGTVHVYKDDATGTEVTTGVTDTEDFDSLTGVHHCTIVLTDAFYATGADYTVVLKAATIDGNTVNTPIAHFSIQNRYQGPAPSAGSAGVSVTAESFTKAGAEPETNTYTSTTQLDGTLHIVEDDATSTDVYYQFDVGGDGIAISVTWEGYGQSVGDSYAVKYYNWGGTAWETVGSIAGAPGTTVGAPVTYEATTAHTGTGANLGKVRFKFESSDGTAIATDRLLCTYSVVGRTVGYAGGKIWVDTNASNTNTEDYVDGTADNPVSTWAAALTLSASLGINRFEIASNSSITLSADSSAFELSGNGLWDLAMGGQTMTGAYIKNADVTGIGSGSDVIFEDCRLEDDVSLPASYIVRCGIASTTGNPLVPTAAGEYVFVDCVSLVAGSGTPFMDFSGTGSATGINIRRWSGGINMTLDSDCTVSHEVLAGGGQTFTTAGADVEIRGTCRAVTLVLTGAGTVQFVGITGPITISGAATTTVNLYGVNGGVTDTSSGTTVTNTLIDTNAAQISADATAADNLELLTENALGADNKMLISSDAQDLSGTLDTNAKTIAGSATIDGIAIMTALSKMLALASGKITRSGNSFTYRNQADDGDEMVITYTAAGRTVV